MRHQHISLLLKTMPWLGLTLILWHSLQVYQNDRHTAALLNSYRELLVMYDPTEHLQEEIHYSQKKITALENRIHQEEQPDLYHRVEKRIDKHLWWIGIGFILLIIWRFFIYKRKTGAFG